MWLYICESRLRTSRVNVNGNWLVFVCATHSLITFFFHNINSFVYFRLRSIYCSPKVPIKKNIKHRRSRLLVVVPIVKICTNQNLSFLFSFYRITILFMSGENPQCVHNTRNWVVWLHYMWCVTPFEIKSPSPFHFIEFSSVKELDVPQYMLTNTEKKVNHKRAFHMSYN